eukprot:scaffold20566_cov135-Isochrysis_galbana.AAC.7
MEQSPADARAAPSASAPNDIVMDIHSSPKRPREPLARRRVWRRHKTYPLTHPHWHSYLSLCATAHATLPRCEPRRRRQHGHGDGAAGGPPRTQLRIRVRVGRHGRQDDEAHQRVRPQRLGTCRGRRCPRRRRGRDHVRKPSLHGRRRRQVWHPLVV